MVTAIRNEKFESKTPAQVRRYTEKGKREIVGVGIKYNLHTTPKIISNWKTRDDIIIPTMLS